MENIVYSLISTTMYHFEICIKIVLRQKWNICVLQIATSSRIFHLFKKQYKNYTKTFRDHIVNLIHYTHTHTHTHTHAHTYTHLHKTVERTLKYLLPKLCIRKPIYKCLQCVAYKTPVSIQQKAANCQMFQISDRIQICYLLGHTSSI